MSSSKTDNLDREDFEKINKQTSDAEVGDSRRSKLVKPAVSFFFKLEIELSDLKLNSIKENDHFSDSLLCHCGPRPVSVRP